MEQHKQTILVIEDEVHIRDLVETILTDNGFVTTGCDSAEKALKKIPSIKPDLILLDIQLTGMNGLECCKRIRLDPQMKDIPIIFLTVQSSDAYKITGLESGGDDFITKPFSHGELLARVKAVLRRVHRPKVSLNKNILKDELITLDLENRITKIENKEYELTPKEFDLLALFLKSRGKVLSRDHLSTQVWERENTGTSRTIDTHIGRLRKKIGKFGLTIHTVGRIGYRYNPE